MNGSHIQSCGAAHSSLPISSRYRRTAATYSAGVVSQPPCSRSSVKPPESNAQPVAADEEIPGQPCARCRLVLPSVRWVPGHMGGEYAHGMPTMFGTRTALKDAQGTAPIVPFPTP